MSTNFRLAGKRNITVGLDMDSTPPAIPSSARPARIESESALTAEIPVMQLSTRVSARMLEGRRLAKHTSLENWGIRGVTTTIPN